MESQKSARELDLEIEEVGESKDKAMAIERLAEVCNPRYESNNFMCHNLQNIYASIAPEPERKEVPGLFSAVCDVAILREEQRTAFFYSQQAVIRQLEEMKKSGYEIFSNNTMAEFIMSKNWGLKSIKQIVDECDKELASLIQQQFSITSVGENEVPVQLNNITEEQPAPQLVAQKGGIMASIANFFGRG